MFERITFSSEYFSFTMLCRTAAERTALPALGRGRRSRPTRKRLRREKGLGCAQNPQRQVHALFGGVVDKEPCL